MLHEYDPINVNAPAQEAIPTEDPDDPWETPVRKLSEGGEMKPPERIWIGERGKYMLEEEGACLCYSHQGVGEVGYVRADLVTRSPEIICHQCGTILAVDDCATRSPERAEMAAKEIAAGINRFLMETSIDNREKKVAEYVTAIILKHAGLSND